MATLGDLTDAVLDGVVGVLLFVARVGKDVEAGLVTVVEVVLLVVAKWALVLALEDHAVQEHRAEHEALEIIHVELHPLVEYVLVNLQQGAQDVLLEPLERLVSHLDPILQDRHGKPLAGHRGEEEPEVLLDLRVGVAHFLGLHEQVRQPVFEQVAVAQDDPVAERGAGRDGLDVLVLGPGP